MGVRLNSHFNAAAVRQQYRLDKRVRVLSFLMPDDATKLLECLARETQFATAFNVDGANGTLRDDEMERLSPDDIRNLMLKIHEGARRGEGFLYGRNSIAGEDAGPGPSLLKEFADLLNSESTLAAIREISGHEDVTAASAQASRYLPGNFLTRHTDFHPEEERRVAYVMSLTPAWHPDWGGLLQFYQQDGTPKDAWSPLFNALYLFDVEHVHAVTYVAPFAGTPRFSIAGWFRAKPL